MSASRRFYGLAEGPLGFPQTDRQARRLDAILRRLPRDDAFRYRKAVPLAATELRDGDRADVSWISTEDPDRGGEVVVASGMDDRHFALNPLVTLNHAYDAPPAGRSVWRRVERQGVRARTYYPPRPADWPAHRDWVPDLAFALVRAGLLRGKSIGFLPLSVHVPGDEERKRRGWKRVSLVVDTWLLLEYACVFLPAQQHALVEAVSPADGPRAPTSDPSPPSDHSRALGIALPVRSPEVGGAIPFTTTAELERALARRLTNAPGAPTDNYP
jgi:hypothetical protein